MPAPGAEELTLWKGWDVRSRTSTDAGAVEQFAQSAPESRGKGAYYELLAVAARGFRPPRLLSSVPEGGCRERARAEEDPDPPGLRLAWSLRYRPIAETAPAREAPGAAGPFAIYLLGVDPPSDITDEELVMFNRFYTDVHLPEVAERRHALRAVRYELVEALRSPYQGAPRYLAVYEVDEAAAANRRHQGPKYTSGPDAWQRHTTPWRLWYRHLTSG